jgi:anti-sigma factor RsiW
MDCLNRLEIQEYIDGEVHKEANEAFLNHLKNCAACRTLWINAKKEIELTNQMISSARLDEKQIILPVFVAKFGKQVRKSWLLYSSVAAGILVIIGVFLYQQMKNSRNERFVRAKLETERVIYESDANKLWNEKQSIITIIDADGNLIYINN